MQNIIKKAFCASLSFIQFKTPTLAGAWRGYEKAIIIHHAIKGNSPRMMTNKKEMKGA